MKVQKFNFENDQIIQIYINQLEKQSKKIIKEIDEIKNKNSNVFIFISGKQNSIKTIKEMLNYEKNKRIE